jgi:hypothetical protein
MLRYTEFSLHNKDVNPSFIFGIKPLVVAQSILKVVYGLNIQIIIQYFAFY